MNVLPQIISCSGGRTSGYLTWLKLLEQKEKGISAHFVFMDTGAEHPKTYEFLRNIETEWCLGLTCLRFDVNPEMGKRNPPKVVPVREIGPDLQPWRDMLSKYGPPGLGRAWCTARMKQECCTSWANITFGKGGWETWLGIRADEPARYFDTNTWATLRAQGLDWLDAAELLRDSGAVRIGEKAAALVEKCKARNRERNVRFLAEISDFGKQDVLDWWEGQSFDLEIPEWLGNCVFCFKKSVTKVAMAAKDEPELAEQFCKLLEEDTVRSEPTRNGTILDLNGYRGNQSLRGIITMFQDVGRDELLGRLKSSRRFDTGSCTESCEVYNEDSAGIPLEEDDPAFGLV